MFQSALFTFLVGPEKSEFLVPSDIVSKASPLLDRLMNGQWKESQQRVCLLPEVDPKTFETFLLHACLHPSDVQVKTEDKSNPKIANSMIIELLLEEGHQYYSCKGCQESTSLRHLSSFSFPRCAACSHNAETGLSWELKCITITCHREARFLGGLLCRECVTKFDVIDGRSRPSSGLQKVQLFTPRRLAELTDFHFDIPLRAQEIVQMMKESAPWLYLPCTDLLELGRLATFADVYQISTMMEAACVNLYLGLARLDLLDADIEMIIELSHMIYDNFCNPANEDFCYPMEEGNEQGHLLRRMISDYIATHCEYFTNRPYLKALLTQNTEMSGDILIAITNNQARYR